MLHGYGPSILAATPMQGGATAREIQASLAKTPDLSTVYEHLGRLAAMGCVVKEGRFYRRLVDSELDLLGVAA